MALTRVTSRGRVFHGWYIVMVAIVANATASTGNYAFGPFVKVIIYFTNPLVYDTIMP